MSVAKIVTVTTLCSLSAIALVNALLGLSKETGNRASSDSNSDSNQDSTKPDQSVIPTGKAAIAQPEKLSNILPSVKVAPAKNSQATPTYSPTKPASVNPLLVPQRRRTTQNSSPTLESEQTLVEQSSRMAPPETIGDRLERSESNITPLAMPLADIEGHWAQYYIEFLANRQIVKGFPNGRFRPNQTVTAAEFATMARRAFQDSTPISYRDLQSAMANRAVTRAEAAALIYRVLVKSEPAPIVTSIQVRGEVSRPGAYSLAAASDERIGHGNNLPTVSRAIQQAGGTLGSANLHQVEIHRLTETGSQRVIKVDVSQALQTGNLTQDMVLQQNDKLVIPAIAPRAQGAVDSPASQ